jgi:hypothetical protein
MDRELRKVAGDFLTMLAQEIQCRAAGDYGAHRSKFKNGLETFYKTELRWRGVYLEWISKKC